MHVLIVHKAYQQRGGEDVVFESELGLLESHDDEIYGYRASNKDVPDRSRLRLAAETIWSSGSKRAIQERLLEVRSMEACAKGAPVVTADTGAMAELVDHRRTGLRCRPGDPEDLAAQVERALSCPKELAGMRREALAEYEARYTAEENYRRLVEIYELAGAET